MEEYCAELIRDGKRESWQRWCSRKAHLKQWLRVGPHRLSALRRWNGFLSFVSYRVIIRAEPHIAIGGAQGYGVPIGLWRSRWPHRIVQRLLLRLVASLYL